MSFHRRSISSARRYFSKSCLVNMNQISTHRSSRIENLPVEIRQAIMGASSDLESLYALALSCSSFYYPFANSSSLIMTRVLINEIGCGAFTEAIVVHEGYQLETWDEESTLPFISNYSSTAKPQFKCLPINEVLEASQFHKTIQYFTDDFVRQSFSRIPLENPSPPSKMEIARIKRCFYIFEIYYMFYRYDSVYEHRNFFPKFSPWEYEQLGCIHDYLIRAVCPVFNDVAEHDVEWGNARVDFVSSERPWNIEVLLSCGLLHIRAILEAKSFKERCMHFSTALPLFDDELLGPTLVDANLEFNDVELDNSHNFITNSAPTIRPPYFGEVDSGPRDAWHWAHENEIPLLYIYSYERAPWREWGYVMWDRARLDQMKLFDEKFVDAEAKYVHPDPTAEEIRRGAEQGRSFARRAEIYAQGGRGWWSFEDESKVVWLREPPYLLSNGVPPAQFDSLHEAKRFLLSLRLPFDKHKEHAAVAPPQTVSSGRTLLAKIRSVVGSKLGGFMERYL